MDRQPKVPNLVSLVEPGLRDYSLELSYISFCCDIAAESIVFNLPQQLVNLLHPLASLAEWKEYRRTPVDMRDAQAVVLGDKVYLGGGDAPDSPSSELLIYDFTEDSWDKLNTPTQWYSLAVTIPNWYWWEGWTHFITLLRTSYGSWITTMSGLTPQSLLCQQNALEHLQ